MGLRLRDLGSEKLTWSDLKAVTGQAPSSSAFRRSLIGVDHEWTLTNSLIATGVDALRWLVWAKTKDGAKNRNRPKPIPRPGVRKSRGRMKDAVSLPIDELQRRLDMPRVEIESEPSD